MALGLLLVLLVGGCGGEVEQEPSQPAAADDNIDSRFGQPYSFSEGPNPDAPVAGPHLEGDTLVAHVAYSGGCEDHRFTLRHDRRADTLRLWLQHDAAGDTCSQQIFQTIRTPLPDAGSGTTVLLPPSDAVPLRLE